MSTHLRTLYRGTHVRIADWLCAGRDRPGAPSEWSTAYEIVVTRRGVYTRSAGGETVIADVGMATCVNREEEYSVRHRVPGGDACTVFMLSEPLSRELIAAATPSAGEALVPRFPCRATMLSSAAFLAHRRCLAALGHRRSSHSTGHLPTGDPVDVEEIALDFFSLVVRPTVTHQPSNRLAMEYAMRLREVVGRRFRESVTLVSLAREVGLSPFHLCRVVRQATGQSVHDIVTTIRLREAVEALLTTDRHVSFIAHDFGFASHSHFTAAFRRAYGCTPARLRQDPHVLFSVCPARS